MRRAGKIVLYVALGLLLLLTLAIVLLMTFDWNRAKPWINKQVSTSLERPFAIRGDLSVDWARSSLKEGGWRRLVPWPQVRAQDIVLGNPQWAADAGNMAQVREVTFSLNPVPLLKKTVSLPRLDIQGSDVLLKRDADGRNNWTFKEKEEDSGWTFELDRLGLRSAVVRLDDATTKADIRAEIDTLEQPTPEGFGMAWTVDGRFNGAPVDGSGKAGAALSLQDRKTPYPVQADLNVGDTRVSVDGTLTDPGNLSGVNMALKVSGASMSMLYPLTGLNLPQTPKFSTEGQLIGTLKPEGAEWRYDKFQGKVGQSDLSGTVTYTSQTERPLLKGELVSKLLRLEDLAALVGADSAKSKNARQETTKQPANKVLPVEPFNTDRWDKLDADITFTGQKFVRGEKLPLDDLVIRAKMTNGALSVSPLNFGVAGGNIISNIALDPQEDGKAVKGKMTVAVKRLKLKQLFPEIKAMKSALGQINGQASITSTGNSVAALLGAADGDLRLLINEGTVSKLLLEAIGLNLGNVVLSQLFGDRQVKLNCLAGDFAIKDGVMGTRTFIVDTSEALLTIDGSINLKQEALDLTINPESKGFRIFSLRAPIYVKGTFKNPDASIDKGVVALRAGSAIALGALAPITALLPLISGGEEEKNQCGEVLSSLGKKTKAASNDKTKK